MLYDLSAPITSELVNYPGDPLLEINKVSDNFSSLHQLKLGNHLGTHIDFPSHVIAGGKTSNDYPLEYLCGACLIVEVPHTINHISKDFVAKLDILPNTMVFFKTANSRIAKHGPFISDYVYLEPEAAGILVQKKVKMVGIDYISVDMYGSHNLPSHRILLANDILIVENLELSQVRLGLCYAYVAPLHIPHLDGLPARVFAEA